MSEPKLPLDEILSDATQSIIIDVDGNCVAANVQQKYCSFIIQACNQYAALRKVADRAYRLANKVRDTFDNDPELDDALDELAKVEGKG